MLFAKIKNKKWSGFSPLNFHNHRSATYGGADLIYACLKGRTLSFPISAIIFVVLPFRQIFSSLACPQVKDLWLWKFILLGYSTLDSVHL